jgi:DNA-binding MarR family transcriptional regulator
MSPEVVKMAKNPTRTDYLDRLIWVGYAIEAEVKVALDDFGLTRIEAETLRRLLVAGRQVGAPYAMARVVLARELGCSAPVITDAVRSLQVRSPPLVGDESDARDARKRRIRLTEQGTAVGLAYEARLRDMSDDLLGGLRGEFRDALGKLESRLHRTAIRRTRATSALKETKAPRAPRGG